MCNLLCNFWLFRLAEALLSLGKNISFRKFEMFQLKPILVDQKIELPPCMYKLKPVSGLTSENMSDNSVSDFLLPKMAKRSSFQ